MPSKPVGDKETASLSFFQKNIVFIISIVVGAAVFLALTSRELNSGNLLAGWNASALCFIAFTWRRMLTADAGRIRKRSADLDFSDVFLLFLSISAAIASIAGIGLELHGAQNQPADIALARACTAIFTILVSWTFLHTLFTLHYAHRYYGGSEKESGLKFPDEPKEPVYWDFLYFSFTIGVAAQTADVAITDRYMRKLALLHAVLSFLFNTTILALAINMGASLL